MTIYNNFISKTIWPWRRCETVQNAHKLRVCSAFSPLHAPEYRDFAELKLLFKLNLIFEVGSNFCIFSG
jgi:hypothetical protein